MDCAWTQLSKLIGFPKTWIVYMFFKEVFICAFISACNSNYFCYIIDRKLAQIQRTKVELRLTTQAIIIIIKQDCHTMRWSFFYYLSYMESMKLSHVKEKIQTVKESSRECEKSERLRGVWPHAYIVNSAEWPRHTLTPRPPRIPFSHCNLTMLSIKTFSLQPKQKLLSSSFIKGRQR